MEKITKIFALLAILLAMTSCEDYLDMAADQGLDENDVFSNYESTRGYLDVCYDNIFDHTAGAQGQYFGLEYTHIGIMSDELGTNAQYDYITDINGGNWYNTGRPEVSWERSNGTIDRAFQSLRIAGRVISVVPEQSTLTEEQKSLLLGQAHFFRAWFYFEIIRRSGGMPDFMKLFDPSIDNYDNMERLSYAESTDLIIAECNLAIGYLPKVWDHANTGRVSGLAAMALKSWAELYAASPLMQNPTTITNHITSYNTERAANAAKYAWEAIAAIETNTDIDDLRMYESTSDSASDPNYMDIFYHASGFMSKEALFGVNWTGSTRKTTLFIHWQNSTMTARTGNWGYNHNFPTQNIVDLFETSRGYPITLGENGWETTDPEVTGGTPANGFLGKCYTDRDPRFNNFIVYPAEEWGVTGADETTPYYLATWTGGRELDSAPSWDNETGYLGKKFCWESARKYLGADYGYTDYDFSGVIIRTTQVWLDYAEAMNEAYGPNSDPEGYGYTAVGAINKIRKRAGHCDVLAQYTTDKETFRERIRNERAVELLFENHRNFDIRRWMIAEELFSGNYPIKGVNFTADTTSSTEPGSNTANYVYKSKDVLAETRVFERKHYWYPLPKDEVERMYIAQNPGW
ncbi:MAG: RagB/SusD family nutrient uptake outer membrane protein [Rikenellaceae bacterium]